MKGYRLKRVFLAALAVVAVVRPAMAGEEKPWWKGPRQDGARVDAIAAMLSEKPFVLGADAGERAVWDEIAKSPSVTGCVAAAEAWLEKEPPPLTEELYMTYFRTGSRDEFMKPYGEREIALDAMTLAECVENRGRFLPAIRRYLEAICAERTWTAPFHDMDETRATARTKLAWKGEAQVLELCSCRRGRVVTCAITWLRGRLGGELESRARELVLERLVRPYLRECRISGTGEPIHWWFFGRNNWNTVCHSELLLSGLALIEDRRTRAELIEGAERGQPNYFKQGFKPDGYCHEGVGYWNYGFGHELILAETVRRATGGRVDFLAGEMPRKCAKYALDVQFQPGHAPFFADGGGAPSPVFLEMSHRRWPDLIPSFGVGYGDLKPNIVCPCAVILATGGAVPSAGGGLDLPLRSWFPDAQVYVGRQPRGVRPFSLATKGGDNGEPHNHNDLGTYSICMDGWEVAGDLGKEPYTFRTFSGWRYDSPLLNSFGHPVPRFRESLQKTGKDFSSKVIRTAFAEDRDSIVYDLTDAYKRKEVRNVVREFHYDRSARTVTVTDRVDQSPDPFETAIVTRSKVEAGADERHFALVDAKTGRRVAVEISSESNEGVGVVVFSEKMMNYGRPCGRRIAIRFAADVTSGSITVRYAAP